MNGNTLIKVTRFHLTDKLTFLAYPWLIQGLVFAVNLAIFASVPPTPGKTLQAGAVAAIYIVFAVVGARTISRRLPFAMALGVSRRSFYTGTVLLALALAALDGLVLALLQPVERATGGWGLSLHFFRVPFLLAGPWYLTWLTSFVALALMFIYGIWFGLIYQRWNLPGVMIFACAQILIVTAALVIAASAHAWHGIGHFFTTLTITGLTGALAALAIVLLLGGYATVRRVTV